MKGRKEERKKVRKRERKEERKKRKIKLKIINKLLFINIYFNITITPMHLDSGSTVFARSSIRTNSQHLSEVIASLDIGNKYKKLFE